MLRNARVHTRVDVEQCSTSTTYLTIKNKFKKNIKK